MPFHSEFNAVHPIQNNQYDIFVNQLGKQDVSVNSHFRQSNSLLDDKSAFEGSEILKGLDLSDEFFRDLDLSEQEPSVGGSSGLGVIQSYRFPFTLSEMRRAPRLARDSLFKIPERLLQALGQVIIRVGLFSTKFSKGGQPEANQKEYTVLIPEQCVALGNFSRMNTTHFGTQGGSHIASVQAVIDLINKTIGKRGANYWLTLNGQLFFLICKFSKNRNKDIPIFKFLNIGQHGLITPNNNLHQQ